MGQRLLSVIIFGIGIGLFWFSANQLSLDFQRFISRLSNAGRILSLMLVLDTSDLPRVLYEMITSVSIAVSSLFMGFVVALCLSFLAADTIAPNKHLASLIRSIVALIRAVPSLVWILMVVASMGFTNTAATVGLIISTVGYLTKSFVASIEDLGTQSIEALRATGAPWITIVVKGLMPQLVAPFVSWIAIRFETSIGESISLGMLGVAGIGLVLIQASRSYAYGKVSLIILVILATMIMVELLVNTIRKKWST